ncbi:MAG: PEP-CTERM sorting domain-containing protein [Candidatus Zixiibacteriota bacterium]
MTKLTRIAVALLMVFAISGTANAWLLDFEDGLGQDQVPIASSIPGLQFTTTDGFDWIYGDATTNNWNVSNDLGDVWGTGRYNMEGYVFATIFGSAGDGRIDFLNQDGSFFTTGYSSQSDFFVEAYDVNDNLIDAASGAANTQWEGVYGLDYLTVSSAMNDIAYVMIHDTGNYWLTDNMSGDASGVPDDTIPEPATLLLLGAGLLAGGIARRKARK